MKGDVEMGRVNGEEMDNKISLSDIALKSCNVALFSTCIPEMNSGRGRSWLLLYQTVF